MYIYTIAPPLSLFVCLSVSDLRDFIDPGAQRPASSPGDPGSGHQTHWSMSGAPRAPAISKALVPGAIRELSNQLREVAATVEVHPRKMDPRSEDRGAEIRAAI